MHAGWQYRHMVACACVLCACHGTYTCVISCNQVLVDLTQCNITSEASCDEGGAFYDEGGVSVLLSLSL